MVVSVTLRLGLRREWFTDQHSSPSLYVFDTLPILLVVVSYNIWFPGEYLKHLGFRLPKEYRRVSTDPEALGLQNR